MSDLQSRLNAIRSTLKPGVELVAVSKYHPAESIEDAYAAGQRIFGESREQELKQKHLTLPEDIEWHFIGHLQTNKVRFIVPYVSMIETLDSERLLLEIEKQAAKIDRTVDVLLEIHIAQEESKSGMTLQECHEMLDKGLWRDMNHIRIRGIMTMASYTDDEQQIRGEFTRAYEIFNELKDRYFSDCDYFTERSYGMSGDYTIAMECHSTMVRVGTAIFGERTY